MDFKDYVRKPFVVEAVEITAENIAEVAHLVGDLREKDDGTPYIYVDRRLVPNIYRVYPGFYMTRMGDHIRCYSRKVFHEQFTLANSEIIAWVDSLKENPESEKSVETSDTAPTQNPLVVTVSTETSS